MATRLYLPSTGAAEVDPAWSVSWFDATSASAEKLRAVTTRILSEMVTKSMTDTDITNRHYAFGMWVSDRLNSQTIAAQNISCSIKCSETFIGNNLFVHWIVRLLSSEGVYKGDILSFRQDLTEIPIPVNMGSRYDFITTTSQLADGGDRLVIEMGLGGNPATYYYHNGSMIIGDNSNTDLNAANDDTGIRNPWVEFSNTLSFMRKRIFITHQ